MLKCPACARTDSDMGTCGSRLTCPMLNGAEPVEVHPDDHVVLRCGPCDRTWAIPVKALLHDSDPLKRLDYVCPRGTDTCAVKAIPLFAVPASEDPPHAEGHAQPAHIVRRTTRGKHQ